MRIKKEHRAMPRKKDYLTVNDFCTQVTLTVGVVMGMFIGAGLMLWYLWWQIKRVK
jgi:hypothetical protein